MLPRCSIQAVGGNRFRPTAVREARRRSAEGQPLDDADLIARAKRGEVAAYEALVQRYQEIAFRVAYLVLGDAAEAEDAGQEAFVKAYRALARFRDEAPFRPWLLQIVANEARNRRAAAGRRSSLALRASAAERPSSRSAVAPSPEVVVLAAEQRALLVQAVGELRHEDRQVIAYRYFLDLSEAEMAVALDCPRGTIKSRLSRALARLRTGLAGSSAAPRRGGLDG